MPVNKNPIYAAIDTVDLAQAARVIQRIAAGPVPAVGGIKLGLEFFLAHGAPGVRYAFPEPVRMTGVGFFLDLKLHDIPNTVAGGIRAVASLEPTYITIHAGGGAAMLKAAVDEAALQAAKFGVPRPKLLGVTVLTSLDDADLRAAGVNETAADQARRLALLGREGGLDGAAPHQGALGGEDIHAHAQRVEIIADRGHQHVDGEGPQLGQPHIFRLVQPFRRNGGGLHRRSEGDRRRKRSLGSAQRHRMGSVRYPVSSRS